MERKKHKDIVEVSIPKPLFQGISNLVRELKLWENEQDFILEAVRLKLLDLNIGAVAPLGFHKAREVELRLQA